MTRKPFVTVAISTLAQPGAGLRRAALVALAFGGALTSRATDGYFSDGYGIKSKGRAGVALTATDDAFGGANNPATVARAGDRVDIGIEWFQPSRSAERSGPAVPLNGSVDSGRREFYIPELGYTRSVGERVSLGLAVYGNGGMNTDYPAGQLNLGPGATGRNLLAGPGHLGVNLTQLLVAPTVALKLADSHSLGLSPILGYQQFRAYGLAAFSPLSQDATALTDVGTDESWGGGVRLGYLWDVTSKVSVGVSYSSPVWMEKFDKYRGLFADDGTFDIPQSVGIGLSFEVLPQLRVGIDYRWIDYASVPGVGNPSTNAGLLGQESGPGFGWHSISVVKFGADWKVTEHWTVRAGYSFNENPIHSRDVTFNILAPGVVQHHLTAGVTFAFGRQEITAAYVHGFYNSIAGESRLVGLGMAPAGTREEIQMAQNSVALEYSFKFR